MKTETGTPTRISVPKNQAAGIRWELIRQGIKTNFLNQKESDAMQTGVRGAMGRGLEDQRIGLSIVLAPDQEVDIADLRAKGLLD